MDPIIQIRDVSARNQQPVKVFSTNIEINKKGHKLYYPSETHTKYRLVRKFGRPIGNLMHFLLTLPGTDHVFISSYSIVVALKHNVSVSNWSPIIDNMIEMSIRMHTCLENINTIKFQISTLSADWLAERWFVDNTQKYLSTTGAEFWRPCRATSNKYLKEIGFPWTKIVPSVLKVPGVERISFLGNAFTLEIGEVFIPNWDTIEGQILNILTEAFNKKVEFKHS